MYRILQYKHWNNSPDQSFSTELAQCSRAKEARGLVRQYFNGHLDVLIKHDMIPDDFELDEENHMLSYEDGWIKFWYEEVVE